MYFHILINSYNQWNINISKPDDYSTAALAGVATVGETSSRETCVGKASRKASIRKASWESCGWETSIAIPRVGSIEGSHSIGEGRESSTWSSSEGSRLGDDMDRCRGLHISVDRGKGSMLSLLSSGKGSRKVCLSSSNLRGVLYGKAVGKGSKEGMDQEFHVGLCVAPE